MSLNKKDIIIRLHRASKTPEEIQSVINLLFAEEIGFATVKVKKNCNISPLYCFLYIFAFFSQLRILSDDLIIIQTCLSIAEELRKLLVLLCC